MGVVVYGMEENADQDFAHEIGNAGVGVLGIREEGSEERRRHLGFFVAGGMHF